MKKPEAILHKHVDKESMDELSENVWPDIVDAMKEHALHVAREAVEEVMKQNIEADLHDVGWNSACNTVLSRIESKLKDS